jgi:hypothetical protein
VTVGQRENVMLPNTIMPAISAGRTVRDVLGEPGSWKALATASSHVPDMHAAVVVNAVALGSELMLETRGGTPLPFFYTFVVENAELREAIVRTLRPGTSVDEALDTVV